MKNTIQLLLLTFLVAGLCSTTSGIELAPSAFDLELQKVRYDNVMAGSLESLEFDQFESEFHEVGVSGTKKSVRRSPGLSFLMSFAVPGLGQYYNGSKIKAAAFLGLEVTGWVLNRKYDRAGSDLEAEFEAFNRAHWQEVRYDSCLQALDKDEGDEGFSHHLPHTLTQQYYEMTGKYDQFSWGWTDARIDDSLNLYDLIVSGDLETPKPSDEGAVPYSWYREHYEQMRYDSNQEYKAARRMASLILVNHLISGLEAFFAARSHNRKVQQDEGLVQWKVKAGLKSYYAIKDTPYLQVSYRF